MCNSYFILFFFYYDKFKKVLQRSSKSVDDTSYVLHNKITRKKEERTKHLISVCTAERLFITFPYLSTTTKNLHLNSVT